MGYHHTVRHAFYIVLTVIIAVSLILGVFTLNQASEEQATLSARLESRTEVLAESLAESIAPSVAASATSSITRIAERFADNQRLAGLAVYDNNGATIVRSGTVPELPRSLPTDVMDRVEADGEFVETDAGDFYAFALPLRDGGRVIGSLMLVQSADYISDTIRELWIDSAIRIAILVVLFAMGIAFLIRWAFFKPLTDLAETLRSIRAGEEDVEEPRRAHAFLAPLTGEISKMTSSLRQARLSARHEARLRIEKIESSWTAERLKEFMRTQLKDRPLFVVSNREPYVHTKGRNGIEWSVPAGGLITALEPVMEATGGMWIAHGSGDADKQAVDENDTVAVPPEEPKYTLKRIWLTPKEIKGYYTGFSNEALWPLCHMAHTRPVFRKEDWTEYRKVNGLFAKTVLNEIRHVERPLVLVQDYHLALLPAMIKKSRPDAQVAIFWHIPWPSPESFSICPWRKEILQGMLGADLIAFQTQQYCNNFMDTVSSEVESLIDYEHFAITHAGHRSLIKAFPISIAFTGESDKKPAPNRSTLESLGIRAEFLGLGVDRLDYTKGLLERFKGIDFFLDAHPEFRERFTFLQIAAPSRESVEKYREYGAQVAAEADRINEKYSTRTWRPIRFEHRNYSHAELQPLYRLADVCLVTSLHDGMNLVAKEYVAARDEEDGVLVLSKFTGAARDLKSALIINPYSAEETAESIHKALTMTASEQHRRMHTMRQGLRDYNVYRWSGELIRMLVRLE